MNNIPYTRTLFHPSVPQILDNVPFNNGHLCWYIFMMSRHETSATRSKYHTQLAKMTCDAILVTAESDLNVVCLLYTSDAADE